LNSKITRKRIKAGDKNGDGTYLVDRACFIEEALETTGCRATWDALDGSRRAVEVL
jgi:hypothetical protein